MLRLVYLMLAVLGFITACSSPNIVSDATISTTAPIASPLPNNLASLTATPTLTPMSQATPMATATIQPTIIPTEEPTASPIPVMLEVTVEIDGQLRQFDLTELVESIGISLDDYEFSEGVFFPQILGYPILYYSRQEEHFLVKYPGEVEGLHPSHIGIAFEQRLSRSGFLSFMVVTVNRYELEILQEQDTEGVSTTANPSILSLFSEDGFANLPRVELDPTTGNALFPFTPATSIDQLGFSHSSVFRATAGLDEYRPFIDLANPRHSIYTEVAMQQTTPSVNQAVVQSGYGYADYYLAIYPTTDPDSFWVITNRLEEDKEFGSSLTIPKLDEERENILNLAGQDTHLISLFQVRQILPEAVKLVIGLRTIFALNSQNQVIGIMTVIRNERFNEQGNMVQTIDFEPTGPVENLILAPTTRILEGFETITQEVIGSFQGRELLETVSPPTPEEFARAVTSAQLNARVASQRINEQQFYTVAFVTGVAAVKFHAKDDMWGIQLFTYGYFTEEDGTIVLVPTTFFMSIGQGRYNRWQSGQPTGELILVDSFSDEGLELARSLLGKPVVLTARSGGTPPPTNQYDDLFLPQGGLIPVTSGLEYINLTYPIVYMVWHIISPWRSNP
jgi:hypothetical protein